MVLASQVAPSHAGSAEPGATAEDAWTWLDRMRHAARRLNYHGTFVYRHGDGMQAMQIVHKADQCGERERLVSLTGTRREVVRDSGGVTCILPKAHPFIIQKGRGTGFGPGTLPPSSADLKGHYSFRLGGLDRVADRSTQVVEISPLDEYRYGYRLWLDVETGLLLKSELLDGTERAIEQFLYTSIEVNTAIPDEMVEPQITQREFLSPPRVADGGGAEEISLRWRWTWLPPGFTQKRQGREPLTGEGTTLEHMLFSDGLASFSVYREPADPARESVFEGPSRMGALHAFGVLLNGHQVTVVGEVPQATVERVARGIQDP